MPFTKTNGSFFWSKLLSERHQCGKRRRRRKDGLLLSRFCCCYFRDKQIVFRLTICFVAVACSDATLTLRAPVLPHRLWFDVASLVSLRSPILSLKHAVVPLHPPHEGNASSSFVYLIISGARDGSIAFWDVTESVEAFVKQVSSIHIVKFIDCQRRPRTGRGSQVGRKWKLLGANISKRTQDNSNSVGEAGSHVFEPHKWCS